MGSDKEKYKNETNFVSNLLVKTVQRIGGQTNINLWNVYNLFTGANKNSYIDNFLDRSVNATELIQGINNALYGDTKYKWFIE